MATRRSGRRELEMLGNVLEGAILNLFVDCSDDERARILWLIEEMEDYAACASDTADIWGRVKYLLLDQWLKEAPAPEEDRQPVNDSLPDDDIPF